MAALCFDPSGLTCDGQRPGEPAVAVVGGAISVMALQRSVSESPTETSQHISAADGLHVGCRLLWIPGDLSTCWPSSKWTSHGEVMAETRRETWDDCGACKHGTNLPLFPLFPRTSH